MVWRFEVCGSFFLLVWQRIGNDGTNVRGIAGLPEVNPEYNGTDGQIVTLYGRALFWPYACSRYEYCAVKLVKAGTFVPV
jgi:hypothetical protein